MNKPSANLNVIKCIEAIRNSIGECLKNEAEKDKKDIEVLLFDDTVDFVRSIGKKLDRYYEKETNG